MSMNFSPAIRSAKTQDSWVCPRQTQAPATCSKSSGYPVDNQDLLGLITFSMFFGSPQLPVTAPDDSHTPPGPSPPSSPVPAFAKNQGRGTSQ